MGKGRINKARINFIDHYGTVSKCFKNRITTPSEAEMAIRLY